MLLKFEMSFRHPKEKSQLGSWIYVTQVQENREGQFLLLVWFKFSFTLFFKMWFPTMFPQLNFWEKKTKNSWVEFHYRTSNMAKVENAKHRPYHQLFQRWDICPVCRMVYVHPILSKCLYMHTQTYLPHISAHT